MNYRSQLKRITEILLEQEDHYDKMKRAVDDLYNLFLAVTELEEESDKSREDIYLSHGKAIGPFWAALCVKELLRTKRFLRGIYKGIKQAQLQFPNKRINILYAGTGPFATLITPMTTMFAASEIGVTMLEINSESIKCLKKVIKSFHMEDYINEIVQCDASQYRLEKNRQVHMIITETMQNALKKEPQVAITMNLVPQMEEGGILIPQCIEVDAVLLDPKRNVERIMGAEGTENDHCFTLKNIFKLSKDLVDPYPKLQTDGGYQFPVADVNIPNNVEDRFCHMCLFTTIRVFGNEELGYNQCSLTTPLKLFDLNRMDKQVGQVCFRYIVEDEPRFEYIIKS